jgi:hypothetical protein
LAAKLSEAESRAIRLLTPPRKKEERNHETHETHEKRDRRETGNSRCSTAEDVEKVLRELSSKLRANPGCRLTIDWTLEE